MKNKIIIIFGVILVGILLFGIWNLRGWIDTKRFNSEKIITERQHALEIAEYNSREYQVGYDEGWYKSKQALAKKEMKKVLDESHQDPKKNKEYDYAPIDEDLDWFPDEPVDDLELTRQIEKIDSTEVEYKDPRFPEPLKFMAYYSYPFKDSPPHFNFVFEPLKFKPKRLKRFSLTVYIGMDSVSGALGYEPLDWLGVGILENVRKMNVEGEDKLYFNSMVGIKINF